MTRPNDVTAADIHRELVRKGMDPSGVDCQKVADAQNTPDRDVPGWEAPRVVSKDWREVRRDPAGGAQYVNPDRRLVAILSCAVEADGRAWLHFSLSHRERVPTHGEMKVAKQVFLGDRYAYAVWPSRERYVNLHPNVLHLFALLDEKAEQPLPDFTGGSGSI